MVNTLKQNPETENFINNLLSQMTIDEKIGQLNQVGPSPVGGFEVSLEEKKKMLENGQITKEEYENSVNGTCLDTQEDDIRNGKIGSFLGVIGAEKCNHLQRIAIEESRLGIPLLFGLDVIHGQHTIFPIPLAESCSWNEETWQETASVTAKEATGDGIAWTFAPMLDIARDARWGRIAEGAGEDTYLTSRFAEAKVRGFQGDDLSRKDKLLSCAKHFTAYGACIGGRDYNTADMSLQTLHEIYLPPFEAAAKAGCATYMASFNDLNGTPCTTNPYLLKTILRDKFSFNGFVVSDANAIAECVNHGNASDRKDAARQAITNGTEMDMGSKCYTDNLKSLLEEGKVSIEQIDTAVRDILRIKAFKGLFSSPYTDVLTVSYPNDTHRKLARKSACQSAVLLKNDNILPLNADESVILVGELADNAGEMHGTWNLLGKKEDAVSIKSGLEKANVRVEYFPCCGPNSTMNNNDLELAKNSNSKVVIAVVGETSGVSGEASSLSDISLSGQQEKMIRELHKSGKKVITILCNGRPLAIPQTVELSSAVIELWHAGTEAGNAASDLLLGVYNPSGRLKQQAFRRIL